MTGRHFPENIATKLSRASLPKSSSDSPVNIARLRKHDPGPTTPEKHPIWENAKPYSFSSHEKHLLHANDANDQEDVDEPSNAGSEAGNTPPPRPPKIPIGLRESDKNDDDEVFKHLDISAYPPPAVLAEIPEWIPEVIHSTISRARENVVEQFQAEKETREAAARRTELVERYEPAGAEAAEEIGPQLARLAEATAKEGAMTPLVEARKGKAKEVGAPEINLQGRLPAPYASSSAPAAAGQIDATATEKEVVFEPSTSNVSNATVTTRNNNTKLHRRFRIRNIFHRSVSSSSSSAKLSNNPNSSRENSCSGPGPDAVTVSPAPTGPSAFTRFIYKHLVPNQSLRSSSVSPASFSPASVPTETPPRTTPSPETISPTMPPQSTNSPSTESASPTALSTASPGLSSVPATNIPPSPSNFLTPTSAMSPVAETIECTSCFDDILLSEGIKTICHTFCRDCFERLVQTAVDNEVLWPPKCCLNPIPCRTITKYVSESLSREYNRKEQEYKVPIEQRIYCSAPDCGERIPEPPIKPADQAVSCSMGHRMCIRCRENAHVSQSNCPKVVADRDMADAIAAEEGWRRCIKCDVLVEHVDACAHITCRCGAQFCYVCGKVWKTCRCKSEDLTELKNAVRKRHEKRQAREALRQIEAQTQKEQKARQEEKKRIIEEQLQKMADAERKRQEKAKIAEVDAKFEALTKSLRWVVSSQSEELRRAHQIEKISTTAAYDDLLKEIKKAREKTNSECDERIRKLQEHAQRQYSGRLISGKIQEKEYEKSLERVWAQKSDGKDRVKKDLLECKKKSWSKEILDDETAKMLSSVEQERTARLGALDRRAIEHANLLEAISEKTFAEKRWLSLIADESSRLLRNMRADEMDIVALEFNFST